MTEQTLMKELDAAEPRGLTADQQRKWDDTAQLMGWTCPGFRHIWYKMLDNGGGKYAAVIEPACGIAATDAKNILINPDEFFKFTLPERVFIMAHEIVHNIYGDVELLHRCNTSGKVPMNDGTSLPFEMGTMQRAMDLRIDQLLVESKIGKPPQISIDRLKTFKGTSGDSVLDVYKGIYKKKPDGKEDGTCPGDGTSAGGFDKLLPPGKSTGQTPSQAAAQRNPQEWAVVVQAARTLESMRAQGALPGAMQRLFKEILEPEVDWTEQVRAEVARNTGNGAYNWKKGDRRYLAQDIFLPSSTGFGAGHIVIWGDTSGSRGDDAVRSNISEIAGIIDDVRPQRLTVLWGDAAIAEVDELDEGSDLATVRPRGGGGTDIDPALQWVEDNCTEPPDMFMAFTDGYLDFPDSQPNYPFLWVSNTDVKYPWGNVVRVLKRARA